MDARPVVVTNKPPPLGIRLLEKVPVLRSLTVAQKTLGHQVNVLFLTFLAYAAFHAARKPTSVVKNVLHRKNCSHLLPPVGLNVTDDDNTWCSWPPFENSNADTLLGWLDSTFLFAYAFGMYFTGPLAERIELRYFLSLGMILSGVFSFLFGIAYWADIHSFGYFIVIQILAGLCQSTGWPGCVAAVGNWFGKSKRGLIMGVWRSHHSVGNMVGSLMASAFVEYNWGLSFAVPSALIAILGFILFLFLASDPKTVGCPSPDNQQEKEDDLPVHYEAVHNDSKESEIQLTTLNDSSFVGSPSSGELLQSDDSEQHQAISFWKALLIPGVIEYSLALFFSKLINYTFLYWLPRYIKESGLNLGDKGSADLSTLFDVGGIFGGILAGLVSDLTGMSAVTCAVSILLAFPMLVVYQIYGSMSGMIGNMALLFVIGLLVNVPYALITTSISADLGTRLKSSKALATVTGILDGTGSIGAAVGPLMAGYLSFYGWQYVFYVLLAANGMALLFLTRLVVSDIRTGLSNWKRDKSVTRSSPAPAAHGF